MKSKIIANYLPQYHRTKENDLWWGEGYTDWVAVKKSTSLYKNHYQPHVPLNNNYYSLDNPDSLKWQAQIAKENGVYGFGIYHYWFSKDQNLLSKPADIILSDTSIDINYMFIWDNSTWKRTWSNVKEYSNDWAPLYDRSKNVEQNNNGILAELKYGAEKEWEEHFDYLRPFFEDERYIKVNGKPVFCFFNPGNDSLTIRKMISFWDGCAQKYGFAGIHIITRFDKKTVIEGLSSFFYEPVTSSFPRTSFLERVDNKLRSIFYNNLLKMPIRYNYDRSWKKIIGNAKKTRSENVYYGCFVGYDDCPRRGKRGRVVDGANPMKFEKYMTDLLQINEKRNNEFIFLTAWNEWGEGAHLEPDEKYGFQYLEALHRAVDTIGKSIYE